MLTADERKLPELCAALERAERAEKDAERALRDARDEVGRAQAVLKKALEGLGNVLVGRVVYSLVPLTHGGTEIRRAEIAIIVPEPSK